MSYCPASAMYWRRGVARATRWMADLLASAADIQEKAVTLEREILDTVNGTL